MLGIIIGVASVIIIMSLGAGAQSLILGQIESIGSNVVSVTPGKSDDSGPPTSVMGIVVTSLTMDDFKSIEKVKKEIGIDSIVAYVNGAGTLSYKNNSYDSSFEGVTKDYFDVEGGEIFSGRFFTEEETENMSKVVVLGNTVKKELFGDSDAVGEKIKINKQIFEVIGILEERGQVAFQNYDDKVVLPLKTAQKGLISIDYLNVIGLKINKDFDSDSVISEVEIILRDNHGIKDQSGESDDFSVRSLSELVDLITTVTDALKYFLALMAGLSLIVGGIGIMNIMLVSVTERIKEIGIRMAVGAGKRDVFLQFIIEAVAISILGGFIGILLGFGASAIVGNAMDWSIAVTPFSVLISVGFSMAIGIFFGWYPASKAANLNLIDALRYE